MCTPQARIVRRLPDGVELALEVTAELPCFRGHYPGLPILAGVSSSTGCCNSPPLISASASAPRPSSG